MMLRSLRGLSLPIFLFAAILFLWVAFPAIKNEIFGNTTFRVVPTNVSEKLAIPDVNRVNNGKIKVYDESYVLMYSLDGGDNFHIAADNELDLSDINNPPIIYKWTSIRWRHPEGGFPTLKSVVLKLRNETNRTESTSESFLFYEENISKLPIVHITMKSNDLFDWNKGIMISGASGAQDEGFQKDWWYRNANFANRGTQWARKVYVNFIPSKESGFEHSCEVRISGNATRHFPQKSLKFYPLEKNGRRGKLAYELFGDDGNKKHTSFLLRQSGNDNSKTLFADLLMHKLAVGSNVLVQNGYPVSVFINGNYWGIYNLRERYDAYLIEKKDKVKNVTQLYCEGYADVAMLKDGKNKHKNEFEKIINSLPEKELSNQAYEELQEKIDVNSFMDYIIFETYYANQDWVHNNTTWYKGKKGKWKWLLNDLDYSLAYPGMDNVESNLFPKLLERGSILGDLFTCLMSNPLFKDAFKRRAKEIINNNFDTDRIIKTFQELKAQYDSEIDLHIKRWRFIENKATWEKNCEYNLNFLLERRSKYLKQVEDL